MTSRSGFDELRFPDDLACTITREQWLRAQEDRDEENEPVRVESVGYSGNRLA